MMVLLGTAEFSGIECTECGARWAPLHTSGVYVRVPNRPKPVISGELADKAIEA